MPSKKKPAAPPPTPARVGFTYRPDAARATQLQQLTRKKGLTQQAIVTIAITEMFEREFAKPRKP